MKKLFLSLTIAACSTLSFSQARLATAEYQKTVQPAVENEYPFPEKTVARTIEEKMEKLGYKGKDTKGFTVYRGVRLAAIGPDSYDLYFKTDKKSKSDNSIVSLMISEGFEKFISDVSNEKVIENAKTFLNGLLDDVVALDLELQIQDQEDVTKKADKKLNNLIEDGEDLQKKKAKIERDIEENKKRQTEQKAELERQRQIFETLRAKRKQ
jgi:hypothetical protein